MKGEAMNIKRPFWGRFLFLLIVLFSWIFLANIKEVSAVDGQSLVVGDIIALGNVDMQVMKNQSIKLNGSAMPVFSESKITTSDGQATLSLSDQALIEISKETTLYVNNDERFIYVKIERGGIRYLLPSNSNTLIETPSVVIGDNHYQRVPTADFVPVQSRCRTAGSRVGTKPVNAMLDAFLLRTMYMPFGKAN